MTTEPDEALLQDWITIWQSEWAALASDREVQEAWQRAADQWGTAAAAAVNAAYDAARRAGALASAGAEAAVAAPDPRDALIRQLIDRVAELERRVAQLGPG